MSSCNLGEGPKKLIPYLVPPDEDIIPGTPRFKASTCQECGAGCGVIARIMDDTPVKLEGNPQHPGNRGALCMRGQASIVRLFHPDRPRGPAGMESGGAQNSVTWKEALHRVTEALAASRKAGKRNVYLSGGATGLLGQLAGGLCKQLDIECAPGFQRFHHGAIREGNNLVFGRNEVPSYRIDKADYVLSIGADLVGTFLDPVRFGRDIGDGLDRGLVWDHAEPHLTVSGVGAHHRFTTRPGSEQWLVTYLLGLVKEKGTLPDKLAATVPNVTADKCAEMTGLSVGDLEGMGKRLTRASNPLVIAGQVATAHSQGLETAVLTALLQYAAGMVGSTVDFAHSYNFDGVGTHNDAQGLLQDIEAGQIGVLFLSGIHGLSGLDKALQAGNVDLAICLTDSPLSAWGRLCDLVLPLSHPLESWGEAEPRKGLKTLIQPTIEPLYDTRMEGDILLALAGEKESFQENLLAHWAQMPETWLDNGVAVEHLNAPRLAPIEGRLRNWLRTMELRAPAGGLSLVLAPTVRLFDGRGDQLSLLNEIPEPLSTVTFGQCLSVGDAEAARLGVTDGDEVTIPETGLTLPVRVQRGLPEGVVQAPSHLAAPALERACGEPTSVVGGITVKTTGKKVKVPVMSGSVDHAPERGFLPGGEHGHHHEGDETLFPEHEHDTYRWAMVVDLDKCNGCSACVAACYIENNVAQAGQEEHLKGREMAWLRVQPYDQGDGSLAVVPMMCQQCDHAPCETVCPVFATYHTPEGLNAQVYNRCVGTRYCANNCPYKARRFNWFDHPTAEPMDRLVNPDVAQRPKGVMEKCTFCIQRIRVAKDKAKDEKRQVRDGDVIPACAQTCPAGAITFGNIMDVKSRVFAASQDARAYRVLESLGTRPAVYYLKSKGKTDHES